MFVILISSELNAKHRISICCKILIGMRKCLHIWFLSMYVQRKKMQESIRRARVYMPWWQLDGVQRLKCTNNNSNISSNQNIAKITTKYATNTIQSITLSEVFFNLKSVQMGCIRDMFTFKKNLLWSHRYLQNYANCMPTDHIHHAFKLFLALFCWNACAICALTALARAS